MTQYGVNSLRPNRPVTQRGACPASQKLHSICEYYHVSDNPRLTELEISSFEKQHGADELFLFATFFSVTGDQTYTRPS